VSGDEPRRTGSPGWNRVAAIERVQKQKAVIEQHALAPPETIRRPAPLHIVPTEGEAMGFPIRVIVLAAASVIATAAFAADVPTIDVSKTCKPIANDRTFAIDSDRCLKSEQEARDQLTREWANFPAGDRTLCTQTATMGGTASYVELITCLEMKRDVAKLPDRGMAVRPAGLPRN
jgi:hypothetical protein